MKRLCEMSALDLLAALYAAADDVQTMALDELLPATGLFWNCDCGDNTPTGEPCSYCGGVEASNAS